MTRRQGFVRAFAGHLPYALVTAWFLVLSGRWLSHRGEAFQALDLSYVTAVPWLPVLLLLLVLGLLFALTASCFSETARYFPVLLAGSASLYLLLLALDTQDVRLFLALGLLAAVSAYWLGSRPGGAKTGRAVSLFFLLLATAAFLWSALSGGLSPFLTSERQPPRSLLFLPALLALVAGTLFVFWFFWRRRPPLSDASTKRLQDGLTALAILAVLLHVVFLSALMVTRVRAFYTPTYDQGIFSQMFYSLRTTGLPLTTLERSQELSHFAIHVSPIFYLWLPFYSLIPRPETLQVLQVLTVASGVLPLILLARHLELKKTTIALLTIVFAFHPGLIGSSMYDVHENCFLTPLLFWLLYALETRRRPLFWVLALLTLCVKEDAALYIVSIAIYMLARKERRRAGLLLMALGLTGFLLSSRLLETGGYGVMTYRFENLIAHPESGLLGVVRTVFVHPGYVVSEMLDKEKLHYLQKVLLPLGFLPLLQRRLLHYAMLLPLAVLNLVSRYPYQANIGFQYHYGSVALLLVLTLFALQDLEGRIQAHSQPGKEGENRRSLSVFLWGKRLALGLALSAALVFGSQLFSYYAWPFNYVKNNQAQLEATRQALDAIPPEASVRASTFLTTYLSSRDFLIDLSHEELEGADPRPADYLAFDLREKNDEKRDRQILAATELGYREYRRVPDALLILQHPALP